MGDLLFKFSGRIGRLGYLLALICMAIGLTIMLVLNQFIGGWKFSGIIVSAFAMLPLTIYLAATSKRFQDRGLHPLVGFILFYGLPAACLYGAIKLLQTMPDDMQMIQTDFVGYFQSIDWTPQQLALVGGTLFGALLLIYGQVSLLFRKGSSDKNVFDEDEALGVEI